MTNPIFSELIQIVEEEYTKEDTVKFMNEVLEQFIKLGTKGITELSEAIEEYAQDNEICNVCGGNIFHIDKEEVYDLESRHNIVVDIIKVCDECGNIIDY